ncbi:MAG: AhpC/TSA family protein [Odoribacteraceae bacterium]|nr:AhpC/TSA family protein [Odoribacteraceae bacterium]
MHTRDFKSNEKERASRPVTNGENFREKGTNPGRARGRSRAVALLAALFLLTSCGTRDVFTLRGTLEGLPDGARITLTPAATHREEQPAAETTLDGQHFVLSGRVDGPRLFRLRAGDPPASELIMLEPGNATLEGEIITTGGHPRWGDFRVEGSPAHLLYKEKTAFRSRLDEAHAALQNREIVRQMAAARAAGDTALLGALSRSPEGRAQVDDERAFFRRAGEEIPAAIAANGDSFWGPLLALLNYNYFRGDSSEYSFYTALSDEARGSFYGKILHDEMFPERLVGKPLPAVALPDREGTTLDVATLLRGKRLLLIDFWASWCVPCRKEIPRLKGIHAANADRGLAIVSISIDKDTAAWGKALDEEQLPWTNLHDNADVFSKIFRGQAIPTLFLVDANGVVIEDNLRGEALQARIEEILGD